MGPFELMNVTGVPIAVHAADGLAGELGDFYLPDPLLIAKAKEGLWEIPSKEEDVEYSQAVYNRLLGVTMAISATLVDEGCASPLDIDLGARVGLRWPKGPISIYNRLSEEERKNVIEAFKEKHPAFPIPSCLTPDNTFSLPTVTEETDDINKMKILSLARPDYSNALNETVFEELDQAVERSEGAPVVILKGKGKNFAAGADIKYFVKNIENGTIDHIVEFTRNAQGTVAKLDNYPGKVIAVVDGFALGGGAEVMLSADIVVVSPRAIIGFPETGIGIYPGLGGTFRLSRRVGKDLARYLIATGTMVNGKDAVTLGIADYCESPQNITPQWLAALEPMEKRDINTLPGKWKNITAFMAKYNVKQLLETEFSEDWQKKTQKKLKYKAPIALELAMELIEKAVNISDEQAAANELAHLTQIFNTEDALTGLKSVGKYRPEFKGK